MLKCVRFILEKGCVSNYVYTLWKEKKTINTIKLKYLFKALKVNSSYDCVQIFIQFVSKNTNKCVLLLTTGGMSSKSTPALCHMTSQCCRRNTLPEKKQNKTWNCTSITTTSEPDQQSGQYNCWSEHQSVL